MPTVAAQIAHRRYNARKRLRICKIVLHCGSLPRYWKNNRDKLSLMVKTCNHLHVFHAPPMAEVPRLNNRS